MQLEDIKKIIRAFRDELDWKQFHSPKDMATAFSNEASELLEIFLWKTPVEIDAVVKRKRTEISGEIADIAAY